MSLCKFRTASEAARRQAWAEGRLCQGGQAEDLRPPHKKKRRRHGAFWESFGPRISFVSGAGLKQLGCVGMDLIELGQKSGHLPQSKTLHRICTAALR